MLKFVFGGIIAWHIVRVIKLTVEMYLLLG